MGCLGQWVVSVCVEERRGCVVVDRETGNSPFTLGLTRRPEAKYLKGKSLFCSPTGGLNRNTYSPQISQHESGEEEEEDEAEACNVKTSWDRWAHSERQLVILCTNFPLSCSVSQKQNISLTRLPFNNRFFICEAHGGYAASEGAGVMVGVVGLVGGARSAELFPARVSGGVLTSPSTFFTQK